MKDVRIKAYNNLIHQPIEFYDRKENATGNLTGILTADIKTLNGASFENYLLILQASIGVLSGIIISLAYSWVIGIA